ncbi:MAG: nitrilase-related carbon-nitrogen hydrolase [Promethearchaeota archaeon]
MKTTTLPAGKLRVAMVQLTIEDGEKEENLARFEGELRDLVGGTGPVPDLVVVPELFTTGYDLKRARLHAETIPGPTVEAISGIVENRCAFVGSILERQGPRLFNTAFVLDKSGELAGKYQKAHLFSPMDEKKYLQPGKDVRLFHLDLPVGSTGEESPGEEIQSGGSGGTSGSVSASTSRSGLSVVNGGLPAGEPSGAGLTIGVLLCYDLRFPELARLLVRQGAHLLVVLAEFPEPKLETWRVLVRARSIENQVPVIAVNRVGPGNKFEFFGHSTCFDGVSGVELGGEPEAWVGELDFRPAREFRERVPCWRDRRGDLYEFKSTFDRIFRG